MVVVFMLTMEKVIKNQRNEVEFLLQAIKKLQAELEALKKMIYFFLKILKEFKIASKVTPVSANTAKAI